MHFRRGLSHDRRRRVLMDEMRTADPADSVAERARPQAEGKADGAEPSGKTGRNYSHWALGDRQPRVTDLIPTRRWLLALPLLFGLSAILALQVLYYQVYLHWELPAGDLRALDVAGQGSLASWFASLLLGLAAVGGTLVYAVRRHRLDDYHGHYRLWVWTVAVVLLASLDAGTGLCHGLSGLLTQLSGTPLYGNGALWWMLPYGVVISVLGMRLVLEMGASKVSTGCLAAAGAGYLAAAVIGLGLIWPEPGVAGIMARTSASLLGHLGLASAIWVYARYVYLDAQGTLPVAATRPASRTAPKTPNKKTSHVRFDEAHSEADPASSADSTPPATPPKKETKPAKPAATKPAKPAPPAPAEQDQQDEATQQRPLTRAERRRQRKSQTKRTDV